MAEVKKSIVETVKAYSSTVTAIFSALVVLYGGFKFVNQGNLNAESNKDIQEQLEIIKKNQWAPDARLDSIEKTMKIMNFRVGKIDGKVDKLTKQFTNHLTKDKSVTKDELMQIINDLDEKKK